MKRSTFAVLALTAVVIAVGIMFSPVPLRSLVYEENDQGMVITKYKGNRPYVNIPDTIEGKPVVGIDKKAFKRGEGKTVGITLGVNIPDSVTFIGDNAFADCRLLSLVLPEELETMGEGAFSNNYMKNIVIPPKVKEIPDYCFKDCKSLESVDIQGPVNRIGKYAFGFCTYLDKITLPEGLVIIDDDAFSLCKMLADINIPYSVCCIGNNAFGWTEFGDSFGDEEFVIINNKLIYKYNGTDENVSIPNGIVGICGGAFRESSDRCPHSIKSINIPESVKYIAGSAFFHCKELESIELPENSQIIGNSIFEGCEKLKNAKLGKCEVLYRNTFFDCASLEKAEFAVSPAQIKDGVFENCTSLKAIDLPNAEEFSLCAFTNSGIESFTFSDKVKVIPQKMFSVCKDLKSVKLPAELEAIEDNAFAGCESLENITLPDGLKKLDNESFLNTGLKSVDMPDSVTSIGNSVFLDCKKLTHIKFSDSLENTGVDCCSGCELLTDVILPKNIKTIDMNSFIYDKALKNIYLPDGLEKIDLNAFADTGINYVFIPDSVSEFDKQAFVGIENEKTAVLSHTQSCKAAQQIEDARLWGSVHDRYIVDIVSSREEADKKYTFANN